MSEPKLSPVVRCNPSSGVCTSCADEGVLVHRVETRPEIIHKLRDQRLTRYVAKPSILIGEYCQKCVVEVIYGHKRVEYKKIYADGTPFVPAQRPRV
jgi:hypothetical protein